MLSKRFVLITCGADSSGKAFLKTVLARLPGVKRPVIFCRDKLKRFEMAQRFPESEHQSLCYFMGDAHDGSLAALAGGTAICC